MNVGDLVVINREMIEEYNWLLSYQAEEPFFIIKESVEGNAVCFKFKGNRKIGINTYLSKKYLLLSPSFFLKQEFKEYFIKNNVEI